MVLVVELIFTAFGATCRFAVESNVGISMPGWLVRQVLDGRAHVVIIWF